MRSRFLVCSFALVACGSSNSTTKKPPPAAAGPSAESVQLCAAACAKRTECVRDSDEAVCNQQCTSGPLGRKIDSLRREVVEDLVACLNASPCGDIKHCRADVVEKANERERENAKDREKPAE